MFLSYLRCASPDDLRRMVILSIPSLLLRHQQPRRMADGEQRESDDAEKGYGPVCCPASLLRRCGDALADRFPDPDERQAVAVRVVMELHQETGARQAGGVQTASRTGDVDTDGPAAPTDTLVDVLSML